jgi:hypothetical protein
MTHRGSSAVQKLLSRRPAARDHRWRMPLRSAVDALFSLLAADAPRLLMICSGQPITSVPQLIQAAVRLYGLRCEIRVFNGALWLDGHVKLAQDKLTAQELVLTMYIFARAEEAFRSCHRAPFASTTCTHFIFNDRAQGVISKLTGDPRAFVEAIGVPPCLRSTAIAALGR